MVSEHIYDKNDLIQRFDNILNKTLEEVDDRDMFNHVRDKDFKLQKGIAGAVIEQCVLGYEPDTKQEADLVVIDNGKRVDTELKVTGMRISENGGSHYVAKEPMSITAVGIYDLAEQKTKEWKEAVKQEYIDRHGALRRFLSYVDLAPKFPPRFRLKKPAVNSIIAKHFNYDLEQLPGKYTTISDIDVKCKELTEKYFGHTIGELADMFDVPRLSSKGTENKGITEQIVVKMFGGNSKKLNQIELFQRFGLIAKSIAITPSGGRTEDMKLYHIDFKEMMQTTYTEEDGIEREFTFEDSELYQYFADHEFLCILFKEPAKEYYRDKVTGRRKETKHPLAMNVFQGFYRLCFTEKFINTAVRTAWNDTRDKIINSNFAHRF